MLFHIYGPMFLIIAIAVSLASLFFVGASVLGTKKPTRRENAPLRVRFGEHRGTPLKLR